MGNQACCVSSIRKDGKSEVVLNSPTARNAFALARANQSQTTSSIQGPSIEPYASSSVSIITNSDLPVSSGKVPLEKAKALAEKKKKELKCRKPPPLADFENPNDYNNNNSNNTNPVSYSTNAASQERKPSEASTNQPHKTIPTLGETAREKLLKKGLPDYWDNMDEDKILSVRLSDKRNQSKGNNSTRRIFSQDEDYQPVPKHEDFEILKPSMEGITERVMPGKIGEEEEELEHEIEDIEPEVEDIEDEQPKIDEEDFYYHEDNSDIDTHKKPHETLHHHEDHEGFNHEETITGRSQAQSTQGQNIKEESEDKMSQNYPKSFRDAENLSVVSHNSKAQNKSSIDVRSYEAPYSYRKENIERRNPSGVSMKSEGPEYQQKEERNIYNEPEIPGNASKLYGNIIASSRRSARKSLGTPGKYARAFTNEDLNGSRLDYNSLLKDSMLSLKKSNIKNVSNASPVPQQTLYVADLLLSAKRTPSISNSDALSVVSRGTSRAIDTLRSDRIASQAKSSPYKGKRLQTEDISPQIYRDSSASPEKRHTGEKSISYQREVGQGTWEKPARQAKLYEINNESKAQSGLFDIKKDRSVTEAKSISKPWELGKPYEGRLSAEGGNTGEERPSIVNGKFVVSELFESNKSGSSWRERDGRLPLRNSRVGGDNTEEKKNIGDSARSRSSWGKSEKGGNEDEIKRLVERTLNRIHERKSVERKSVERAEISPLPLPKERYDLNLENYATGNSLSRVGSRGSFRMRDSQRWESVQRDVQKLVDNATKPRSGLLETYLKCSKENKEGVPKIGSRRNSRDWKGLLDKRVEYSHPSWGGNSAQKSDAGKENQQEQQDQGDVTPGFPKLGETGLNRKWENYTTQERKELLLNKKFLNIPTANLQKNV